RLPLGDLLVSVRGGRVVLRSRRLGREVVPRQSNACGARAGSALHRLLAALQDQGGGAFSWSWGALDGAPFLPRVCRGDLVLARARWNLSGEELAEVAAAARRAARGGGGAAAIERVAEAMSALRRARGLPRFVALVDGDRELPVDLDNPLSADAAAGLLAGGGGATLAEVLPGPDDLCARGPDGAYQH